MLNSWRNGRGNAVVASRHAPVETARTLFFACICLELPESVYNLPPIARFCLCVRLADQRRGDKKLDGGFLYSVGNWIVFFKG